MSKYKPTPRDTAWAENLMHTLRDGSPMRMPSPNLTYRKKGGEFVLIQGDPKSEIHKRTITVFKAAGYNVRVELEDEKAVKRELRGLLTDPNGKVQIDAAGILDAAEMLAEED